MPSIFVHRIIRATCQKPIERLRINKPNEKKDESEAAKRRERIVRRVAIEFRDGMHVNLGKI
jgi:3-oxoacid CoA-transferase